MKGDRLYLTHILECIITIEEYTVEGKKAFFAARIIQDAVIRNLEIIGEATKKISQGIRDQYSDIPWREMAGMRDVLIHEYFGVDLNIIWNVVESELPKIKSKMTAVLQKMDYNQ
jgi:uncharacterized protein with HEPN domain